MMKISKPVLMNHFTVSHVQFTSLNLVNFKNVKAVYDGNEKILLEYEHPSKVKVSSRDWVGIFPRGWINLQQYVTFEWISQAISNTTSPDKENGDVVRRTIAFCPKYHMNCVNQCAFYQFVYVGKQIEVLGVSSYFRFDLSCLNFSSIELECLVPVTGKVRSTSVSDFGTLSSSNEQSSTFADSRKLIHASSIHSLQNLDVDGKLNWSRMNFMDDKKNMCLLKRTSATPSGTGDNIDPYTSHSEPVFAMSLPLAQCKKCYQFKKGGEFLRSQQALQSKVGPCTEEAVRFVCQRSTLWNPHLQREKLKIVMERNKVLEERTQEMKKELERLQSESKRLKMSYFNVNKEKVAYENFVKDFIKSLEKDSIVRVMYGNTEILVKKVNYVGMEEHPRDKKTSKRERELKAVIGLQEITIRNLINSLQEKAKSVEELNQTVKLAQVFSAARTGNPELGIDTEESADELSNSGIPSEYEFSLAKPPPPEEVSADAENVLNSIRRTSEMELKNIGITRSLGDSESTLDVTNLSILSYDSDNSLPKKPRLLDNVEDCWPFPRNTNKTLRQKLSEDSMKIVDQKEEQNEQLMSDVESNAEDSSISDTLTEVTKPEMEIDPAACEDYYDACDAFSVRSCSPECEPLKDTSKTIENQDGDKEMSECLLTAVVPKEISDECSEKYVPPEKFNKFTCELSIDFVQRRHHVNEVSDKAISAQENSLDLPEAESDGSQVYALERERSLVMLKKSNKCVEIKITKVDQKENPCRNFQQKMVVQFVGSRPGDGQELVSQTGAVEESVKCLEVESGTDRDECSQSKSESCVIESPVEGESVEKPEGSVVNETMDVFSPRTEWDDANEVLEDGNRQEGDLEGNENGNEESEAVAVANDGETSSELTSEETIVEVENNESESTQQLVESNCNIQVLTEDSIKNLKIYQDSLRYEKNLQFLNNKIDERGKESDDEVLKEKPSAIIIQSGQAKVAVIRYQ